MSSEIHVDDVGTKFVVTVLDDSAVVDISPATNLIIYFRKPDNSVLEKTASLSTDGTDGKMYYITESGDLDLAGNYKIQGKVILSTGTYYTSLGSFKVHCNI
jgi:hypothetical protein